MEQLNINKALNILKKIKGNKIEDKFIVVHPINYSKIKQLLEESNTYIEMYHAKSCDKDKVYIIDKLAYSLKAAQ